MAKYCANCGAELDSAALTCPVCGQSVAAQPTQGGNPPAQTDSRLPQQTAWNSQAPQSGWEPPTPRPTMKWFKFIIWVQLFLAALSDLGAGLGLLTGMAYGDYVSDVYAMFPVLRPLDILEGLLCLALAVAAIYVRFQLSGYKQKGPTLYLCFLLASSAVSLVYVLVASLILRLFAGDFFPMLSLAANVVVVLLNLTYFEKRRFLFVN